MPFFLQKVKGNKYYVVDTSGDKYSKKPLPKARAERQLKALHINTGHGLQGGDLMQTLREIAQQGFEAFRDFLFRNPDLVATIFGVITVTVHQMRQLYNSMKEKGDGLQGSGIVYSGLQALGLVEPDLTQAQIAQLQTAVANELFNFIREGNDLTEENMKAILYLCLDEAGINNDISVDEENIILNEALRRAQEQVRVVEQQQAEEFHRQNQEQIRLQAQELQGLKVHVNAQKSQQKSQQRAQQKAQKQQFKKGRGLSGGQLDSQFTPNDINNVKLFLRGEAMWTLLPQIVRSYLGRVSVDTLTVPLGKLVRDSKNQGSTDSEADQELANEVVTNPAFAPFITAVRADLTMAGKGKCLSGGTFWDSHAYPYIKAIVGTPEYKSVASSFRTPEEYNAFWTPKLEGFMQESAPFLPTKSADYEYILAKMKDFVKKSMDALLKSRSTLEDSQGPIALRFKRDALRREPASMSEDSEDVMNPKYKQRAFYEEGYRREAKKPTSEESSPTVLTGNEQTLEQTLQRFMEQNRVDGSYYDELMAHGYTAAMTPEEVRARDAKQKKGQGLTEPDQHILIGDYLSGSGYYQNELQRRLSRFPEHIAKIITEKTLPLLKEVGPSTGFFSRNPERGERKQTIVDDAIAQAEAMAQQRATRPIVRTGEDLESAYDYEPIEEGTTLVDYNDNDYKHGRLISQPFWNEMTRRGRTEHPETREEINPRNVETYTAKLVPKTVKYNKYRQGEDTWYSLADEAYKPVGETMWTKPALVPGQTARRRNTIVVPTGEGKYKFVKKYLKGQGIPATKKNVAKICNIMDVEGVVFE